MRIISTFLLLGIVAFLNSCDTETPEKAAKYYNNIVNKVNLLTGTYEKNLTKAIETFDPENMNSTYKSLEEYVLTLEKDFAGLTDFYGDNELLTSANNVIRDYKQALPWYKDIVKNESISQANYTDENGNIYNDLIGKVNNLLNKTVSDFKNATLKFGGLHKVKILPEVVSN